MKPGRVETESRRPLSPRLSVYTWGPTMLASLAHRASGIILVLFVPVYLELLRDLTGPPGDFAAGRQFLHTLPGRLWLWLTAAAFVYHLCNGIRFLLLDAGWGEGRGSMRSSARMVLVAGVAAALVLAVGVLL